MDLGDIITGVFVGLGAGVVIGMCVPENKKGAWIKKRQDRISKQWEQYAKDNAERRARYE